jgi:hypothetical protein
LKKKKMRERERDRTPLERRKDKYKEVRVSLLERTPRPPFYKTRWQVS